MGKVKRPSVDTMAHKNRMMLVTVFSHLTKQSHDSYIAEFESLAKTAGIVAVHQVSVRLREFDPANLFGKGKLQELIEIVREKEITDVIFSCQISPLQERNLQEMLGCTVFDRTQLILEIFEHAAHSAEGKIQVEMAWLEHLKTRLAGRGKEMAQQAGFVGAVGPGETLKEHLRRYYAGKMQQAKRRLDQLKQSRETQRKQRLKNGIPLVCLVGYTNAGKSSLMNALTKSDVLVEDKLFATLDTTVRELYLAPHKKALISDTVGFISELSHQLVEAFKSTLDELKYAQMLIHVMDVSNPAWREQANTVQETLKDLGATAPVIYAANKIDLVPAEEREQLEKELTLYQPYILTSAKDKESVQRLIHFIASRL